MRKRVIAGNWKMYKTRDEALSFIYEVAKLIPDPDAVETVICAPSIMLRDLVKREDEHLRIGAQNMSQFDEGAYTGEISATMLTSYGVEYVVLGHSERRQYFYEDDAMINAKTKQALKHQITPIICVGESLGTRESNQTNAFVKEQITEAFKGIPKEDALKTIVAYEPIWAIGTGKTATKEQANDTISFIRQTIEALYDASVSDGIRILYGGSVKPGNIDKLLSMSDIDGALIGGASLDPQSYLQLVQAALK